MEDEKKIVVGIWGAGVVGSATGYIFEKLCPDKVEVIYYDTDPKKPYRENKKELLQKSDFVFICLPTPMKITGEISLKYIDDSLKEISKFMEKFERDNHSLVFIIRSTSVSGSTDEFAKKYPLLDLAFCPEFLTEANSKEDALFTNKVVIGANDLLIYRKIEALFKLAYEETEIAYIHLNRKEAEMFKYFSNVFLAAQAMVANELYFICRKLGLNYDKIRKPLINDRRIGTFTQVPGPDGDFGVGGKCLVPGTMVFTDNFQLLPIEEIQIGDKIFDGSKFTEVTKTGARFVNDLIDIKSRGRKITGSPDHIQLVYNPVSLIEKQLKDIDIITDKLFIPLPDNNSSAIIHLGPVPNNKNRKVWHEKIELNNQIARLIGLYLAEGCISGKSTIWSFGEKEEDFANEVVSILSKEFGIHSRKFLQISNGTYGVSRCWMVKARSEWLKTFLKEMNTGKKGIEKDIRIIPKQFIPSLIGGWLDGDGNSERNTISGFSRSKKLILKMDYMLLSLGICCSIGKNGQEVSCGKRDDVKEITSWTKRHKKYNDNNYSRKKSNASPNTFFTTVKYKDSILQGWVTDIRSINKSEGGKVISLETKSGTYVANNILTHNCFPKDVNALIYLAKENGVVPYILETMMKWNDHIRMNKDWIQVPGAVEDCLYEHEKD
jgi:UDPglucose 6-dehydrogenase